MHITELPASGDDQQVTTLEYIARGGSIWKDPQGSFGSKILEHYQLNFAALPSHTQTTERAVKEANNCSKINRTEHLQTRMACARSISIEETRLAAEKAMREKKIKQTKEDYKEDKFPMKIKGTIKTQQNIEVSTHNTLFVEKKLKDPAKKDQWDLILERVANPTKAFAKKRQQKKVDKVRANMHKPRALNKPSKQ